MTVPLPYWRLSGFYFFYFALLGATAPFLALYFDHLGFDAERIGELIEGGNAWVAASGRGDILGFLVAERRGDGLHIWEVSVMQAQQGQGIGRQLIAAAVCAAREQRLARVTLTTFSDVPWNRPFYERLGFVCQPERESAAWLRGIVEQERAQGLTQRCIMALAIGR